MAARVRILVACEGLVLSGGLLRFERLGRALPADRYDLAYVSLADRPLAHWSSLFPVLDFAQCAAQTWDFVMVPGAGFSDTVIERLAWLGAPRFGRRVQHVLNDRSLKPRFLRVNGALRPHVVVFNSPAWPPGSYTEFQAEQFHTVAGGVDTDRFRLGDPDRSARGGQVVVGGLAGKNAEVLIDALALLPGNVRLKLMGDAGSLLRGRPGVGHAPRVELTGALGENDLPDFYRGIDIAVHTELRGGWSNFAAEAMASGVPLVCTAHGTAPFARDGETALVLREVSVVTLADAVARLIDSPAMADGLRQRARRSIEAYSWPLYARQLMAAVSGNSFSHYTYAPEHGLFGKWTLQQRLDGLGPLLAEMRGRTVLDLGSGEGIVALRCLESGADRVVGLEVDGDRVAFAAELCRAWPNSHFEWADVADVTRARALIARHGRRFDVVLYLGVHHHLPPGVRATVLDLAMEHAAGILAVRMPADVYRAERVEEQLSASGFGQRRHIGEVAQGCGVDAPGPLVIWQRADA